jgi:hypothetical protein
MKKRKLILYFFLENLYDITLFFGDFYCIRYNQIQHSNIQLMKGIYPVLNPQSRKNNNTIPCGRKDISVESEKNNRFIPKKLDSPVKKKPNPPKLTASAQKILLKRLDPLKYDLITEFVSV